MTEKNSEGLGAYIGQIEDIKLVGHKDKQIPDI